MATPIQVNYPQTTFELESFTNEKSILSPVGLDVLDNASVGTSYNQAQITSSAPSFDMNFAQLTFQGVAGTNGQVLTANSAGQASFQDLPAEVTPNLAQVLAVATAGDAGDLPISNLQSLAFNQDTSGAVLTLAGLKVTGVTDNVLNISTPADTSLATKQFSRNYLPIAVAGQVYYLQLFSVV
jgi:hypothetical protein